MALNGTVAFPRELVERYTARRWWSNIPLGQMLDRTADLYPRKVALVAGDERLTFGDLRTLSDRAALGFHAQGIRPRDRVFLQVPNRPAFVHAYFGLCKIGAVPVMCRPRFSERDMEVFADLTGAVGWVVPLAADRIDFRPMIASLRASRPGLAHVFVTDAGDAAALPAGTCSFSALLDGVRPEAYPDGFLRSLAPDPNEICHMMPTGGTTGLPKLVPRTHNDWYCNVEYRAKAWERGPRDVTLVATPLTHNLALEVLLTPAFLTGGAVVLSPTTDATDILEAIQRERVTIMTVAVAQAQQMLDHPDLDRYDLSSLEVIATAGSHAPAPLIVQLRNRLGGAYLNVFGMSEGPCAQTRLGDPDEVTLHTVGRPICPYDEFKILDDDRNELPPGAEGDLVARGPCVFRGYYKSEADNAAVFTPDGFFYTGDRAKFDACGNLVVTGRVKDIINRGGVKISASSVEDAVSEHPGVQQVAAVAMPDRILGERVCAYVVPKPGATLTLEALVEHLRRAKVSVNYLPERIEILDALPLSAVGKTDKNQLREDIKTRLARETEAAGV